MSKPKYSSELKIRACEDFLSGKYSAAQVCEKYGITYNTKNHSSSSLNEWVAKYMAMGSAAFINSRHNKSYSSELKIRAVEEYLAGKGSILDITAKYGISGTSPHVHMKTRYLDITAKYGISGTEVFRRWILKYNANRELKDYDPKQEVYMAEARRKTTFEERREIVTYCINHNRDYKSTAAKYDVSYSQVYSWVKKYDVNGEDGLTDKRGHHKPDDEVDELERLRRENLRLKRRLEEKDMVVELLKKVKEFERM
ncbi:MAG: transposase [Lachnospiraceae bacterium]|nr:transposase [Lachnospiraceae bacterium]